mgnify:CR=1 FL=1
MIVSAVSSRVWLPLLFPQMRCWDADERAAEFKSQEFQNVEPFKCENDGRGNALLFLGAPLTYMEAQKKCAEYNSQVVEVFDKTDNDLILHFAKHVSLNITL